MTSLSPMDELKEKLHDAIWTNAMSSQSAELVETLVESYANQRVDEAREEMKQYAKDVLTDIRTGRKIK